GQTISGLVGSCNGGLLATTMPDARRGSASGWLSAGNQCGAAVSSSVALYMTGHDWPPLTIGLVLAAMMIIPSLAVLVIVEPVREVQRASAAFKATISDVRNVLFSKRGITGILLCMSPVGTAALINYFSAIGIDYVAPGMDPSPASITVIQTVLLQDFETARMTAASVLADEPTTNLLALLTGPLGAAVIAIGSVGGGYLCDRFNRRAMYLAAGVLVAIVGIAMALSPRSETTLIWGALTYELVMGFAFTAFYAVVLESIGKGGTAAATQYSLFVAAGNAAIAYVGLIDSQFHENHGVEGVVASDSALNIGGVIILGAVFWYMGFFKRKPKDPDPDVNAPVPAGT
ncbi:MAG: MFS transporter, partial [Kofleriaceae bacterium]